MFKPLKGSKISRYRLLKVIECFCLDIEASKAAFLVQLNRNTINRLYGIFRQPKSAPAPTPPKKEKPTKGYLPAFGKKRSSDGK